MVPCWVTGTPEAVPVGRTSPMPACQLTAPEYERMLIEPPARAGSVDVKSPFALMMALSSVALFLLETLIEPPSSPPSVPEAEKALPFAVTAPAVEMTRIIPETSLDDVLPFALTPNTEESAASGP